MGWLVSAGASSPVEFQGIQMDLLVDHLVLHTSLTKVHPASSVGTQVLLWSLAKLCMSLDLHKFPVHPRRRPHGFYGCRHRGQSKIQFWRRGLSAQIKQEPFEVIGTYVQHHVDRMK